MEFREKLPMVVIQPIIFTNENFKTTSSTMAEKETDFVINLKEKHRFPIKRSVLLQRCPYFTSMYKHGFKEENAGENAGEIVIEYDVEVTVFTALLDYIRTGIIELCTGNLEQVIRAAIYFQLEDVVKFCCNVFKQNINIETVGHIYNLAKELALIELRKAAVDFAEENFHIIAESEVFYEWILDCMLELLASDKVVVSHEKKILKFVFDWLKFDLSNRGEHATDIFRTLRFSYLKKENIKEVVEENPNEKLGQILQQVASEFSNKITPPRIYHKGIYVLRRNSSDCFIRYGPDDGSVTNLKTPNLQLEDETKLTKIVGNNDDLFMVQVNRDGIQMEKYDVKKDKWTARGSTTIEKFSRLFEVHLSYCQEKLFVFLDGFGPAMRNVGFCMMHCFKTNTWQRLPAFEGKHIASATTGGNCIYIMWKNCISLLQYKPSTGELITIPCSYDVRFHKAIAYKSMILFVLGGLRETRMVVFNTETKNFRFYYFDDTRKTIDISRISSGLALFKESVYVFTNRLGNVYKLDLSFIDEMKNPTLLPLPDSGMKTLIWDATSIQ